MSHIQTDNTSPITSEGSHLETMAQKYPWCSLAQLSLLKEYKKNNASQFEEQSAKTALFFNNSLWLNWQLHLSKNETAEIKQVEIVEPIKAIAEKAEENNEPIEVIDDPIEENNDDRENEKIRQSLAEISLQEVPKEDTISFDPMHTVDYFGSQGIKVSQEIASNDKLGNQMKSFTEWLKSMKKVHKEKLGEGDEQTDKNIQQIAEFSNADAEVVTEAMADVLIKQKKTDKAIEVYEKLSLMNPSKSAYFAAKIDSLKTH